MKIIYLIVCSTLLLGGCDNDNHNGKHVAIFSDENYGFSGPKGITADKDGNIWVMNTMDFGSSVTEMKKAKDGHYSPVIFSGPRYRFDMSESITADRNGNIWVTNNPGLKVYPKHKPGSITEIKKDGKGHYHPVIFLGSLYKFNNPQGISVDTTGNVWVGSWSDNSITELKKNTNGTYSPIMFSGSQYGFNAPNSLTTDSSGNVWVANNFERGSVTEMRKTASGTYVPVIFSNPSYLFSYSNGITADNNGNIWVTNLGWEIITEIKKQSDGSYSPVIYTGQFNGLSGISADPKGNIWIANQGMPEFKVADNVIEFKKNDRDYSEIVLDDAGYGFNALFAIATDSNGNVWVPNNGNDTVTEIIN